MSRYYALTVNTRSQKNRPSEKSYNRALDKLETVYDIVIFPRYFEIAPLTGKLHVHCMVTQDLSNPPIKDVVGQKNHIIKFKPIWHKSGWLDYAAKDQPKKENKDPLRDLPKPEAESCDSPRIPISMCYPHFDIRQLNS